MNGDIRQSVGPGSRGQMPTVAIETLGCKLNQYESDALATELGERGFSIVDSAAPANVRIVNSCTVTNKADRKSRNAVYRAARGGADILIVTGCGVDSGGVAAGADLATYLVDNARKSHIPDIIEGHLGGQTVDLEALADGQFDYSAPGRLFHTRTTLKIQDGCDNFCTFCIIPFVRGRAQSRESSSILAEAANAIENGAREIVLTGVNMSRYRDGENDFVDLARRLLELDGEWRLRISSLEPDGLDGRFVDLFAHPRMMPHLHLCLQSGSDRVLLAMRRMYTSAAYRDVVNSLRARNPLFNITTDLIVGFPGEKRSDHERSLAAVDEFTFGHVHLFPYSVRSGTRAERLPDQIPGDEQRRRAQQIEARAALSRRAYRTQLIGREDEILIERVLEDGRATGLGRYYTRTTVHGLTGARPNSFVPVRLTGMTDGAEPVMEACAL